MWRFAEHDSWLRREQTHDCCYAYKAREVGGSLLVWPRDSAMLFHPSPEPLDEIQVLVQILVMLPLFNPIFIGGITAVAPAASIASTNLSLLYPLSADHEFALSPPL